MEELFKFFPEKASTIAEGVDNLFIYLTAVTTFFGVLVFALVIIFAIIYKRKHEDEVPEQIHGNTLLEIIWSFVPLLFVISFFVWGTWLYIYNNQKPENPLEIFVVGKQWMWKIQHPEGPREINSLHVPINRPVQLLMTSEDVIHSFYIPAFRVKMDTVPGKYSQTWFEATKPGEYHLFCAEYCGTKHSQMIGTVYAMREEDYEEWLNGQVNPSSNLVIGSPAQQGEKLFQDFRCNTCHLDDTERLGPRLEGIFNKDVILSNGKKAKRDENYIRESILYPNKKLVRGYSPLMPSFDSQLNEEQVMALLSYIKSLTPLDDSEKKQKAIDEALESVEAKLESKKGK